MRFKTKKSNRITTKKWFAFFPVEINGETRWLEFVKVRGFYRKGFLSGQWTWENIEFVD
jgi:hypothetical protein